MKKRKEEMEEMKGKEDTKAIRKQRNLIFRYEFLAASFRKPMCFDYCCLEGMNMLQKNSIYIDQHSIKDNKIQMIKKYNS